MKKVLPFVVFAAGVVATAALTARAVDAPHNVGAEAFWGICAFGCGVLTIAMSVGASVHTWDPPTGGSVDDMGGGY